MEYEGILSQGVVQQIGRVAWDAMDQYIVIETMLGPTPENVVRVFLHLHPPAAIELSLLLSELIQEKPPEAGLTQ